LISLLECYQTGDCVSTKYAIATTMHYMYYIWHMNTMLCPNCKKEIDIPNAIMHKMLEGELAKAKSEDKEEFERQIKEIEEKTKKKIEEQLSLKLKDSQNELEQTKIRKLELQNDLLESKKQLTSLKLKDEEREIENQKWKARERDLLSEEIVKKEREKSNLEKRELEIQIESMKKALEEANSKGGSKSQQLQGEALELEVFKKLKELFPSDDISEVAKGASGGDIRQLVKSPKGYPCGSILWECKRAKWDEKKFVEKLKLDQRAEGSTLAVIVSINLPKDAMDGFINRGDDIWICSLALVAPVAVALRKMLLDAAFQKALAVNRGEKKEDLFSYITGPEFVQPVKTIVEVYSEMILQISKERAAYEKMWKQRESQSQRIINSMASIVGKIQGKIGASALQIKELDLIESGDK
jgi:hypothetical protein